MLLIVSEVLKDECVWPVSSLRADLRLSFQDSHVDVSPRRGNFCALT